jgi:hypothetical protein
MAPAFRSRRQCDVLRFDREHLAAQEQDRAHSLILRAGRNPLPHGQVGEVVPDCLRIDARMRPPLTFGEVAEKAPHPVGVAALRAVRVVPGPDARSKLLERCQRVRAAFLVHDSVCRTAVPIRAVQKVHEVDAEGLFSLTHLPVLP